MYLHITWMHIFTYNVFLYMYIYLYVCTYALYCVASWGWDGRKPKVACRLKSRARVTERAAALAVQACKILFFSRCPSPVVNRNAV